MVLSWECTKHVNVSHLLARFLPNKILQVTSFHYTYVIGLKLINNSHGHIILCANAVIVWFAIVYILSHWKKNVLYKNDKCIKIELCSGIMLRKLNLFSSGCDPSWKNHFSRILGLLFGESTDDRKQNMYYIWMKNFRLLKLQKKEWQ